MRFLPAARGEGVAGARTTHVGPPDQHGLLTCPHAAQGAAKGRPPRDRGPAPLPMACARPRHTRCTSHVCGPTSDLLLLIGVRSWDINPPPFASLSLT